MSFCKLLTCFDRIPYSLQANWKGRERERVVHSFLLYEIPQSSGYNDNPPASCYNHAFTFPRILPFFTFFKPWPDMRVCIHRPPTLAQRVKFSFFISVKWIIYVHHWAKPQYYNVSLLYVHFQLRPITIPTPLDIWSITHYTDKAKQLE